MHEAELAPNARLPGERRAVAMAAGYLDPPVSNLRDPMR